MDEFNWSIPPILPYERLPKRPFFLKIPMSREVVDANHCLWAYEVVNGKLIYTYLASCFIEEEPQFYKTKRGFKELSKLWRISEILENGKRMITVDDGDFTYSYIYIPTWDEPYLY